MQELQQPTVGDQLASFRIEELVGRGGMGLVFRAWQKRPERMVALKVIAPELASDDAFRARFQHESSVAAQIEHHNVIPVYEVGEDRGIFYIAMRFVYGTDLGELRRRAGRLEPPHAAYLIGQVASALDEAHACGLVHRDVKPGNVLVSGSDHEEHVYLTDFGLTKRTAETQGLTATGTYVGTLDYIAPEQVTGERVAPATDVYSLGCVLYELLSGSVPFPRETDAAKVFAHVSAQAPVLTELAPDVPAQLSTAVERAMAKDPADRYGSAGEFARAVRDASNVARRPTGEHATVTTLVTPAIATTESTAAIATPPVAPTLPQPTAASPTPTLPQPTAAPAAPQPLPTKLRASGPEMSRSATPAGQPAAAGARTTKRRDARPATELEQRRRSRRLLLVSGCVAVGAAVALVAILGSGGSSSARHHAPATGARAVSADTSSSTASQLSTLLASRARAVSGEAGRLGATRLTTRAVALRTLASEDERVASALSRISAPGRDAAAIATLTRSLTNEGALTRRLAAAAQRGDRGLYDQLRGRLLAAHTSKATAGLAAVGLTGLPLPEISTPRAPASPRRALPATPASSEAAVSTTAAPTQTVQETPPAAQVPAQPKPAPESPERIVSKPE